MPPGYVNGAHGYVNGTQGERERNPGGTRHEKEKQVNVLALGFICEGVLVKLPFLRKGHSKKKG